jgi:hypothetical protein
MNINMNMNMNMNMNTENKKIRYISGPISLYELYDEKNGKHMYLFGDYHLEAEECRNDKTDSMQIANFLKNLFISNPNKHFDLFVEEVFIDKEYGKRDFMPDTKSHLGKVVSEFNTCFEVDKSACKYKNVRFHYVDIRSIDELNFINILAKCIDNPQSSVELFKSYPINNINELILLLSNSTETKNYKKILKQIENISDPAIKEIANYYLDEISRHQISVEEITNIIEILKGNKKINIESFKNILNRILESGNNMMNAYLLARMYRNFRQMPNQYSEPPKNIIVYAGNTHIKSILMDLKEIGIKIMQKHEQNSFDLANLPEVKCIDLQSFTQPFFSSLSFPVVQQENVIKGGAETSISAFNFDVTNCIFSVIIVLVLLFIIALMIDFCDILAPTTNDIWKRFVFPRF